MLLCSGLAHLSICHTLPGLIFSVLTFLFTSLIYMKLANSVHAFLVAYVVSTLFAALQQCGVWGRTFDGVAAAAAAAAAAACRVWRARFCRACFTAATDCGWSASAGVR
jgi:hypothetical protein